METFTNTAEILDHLKNLHRQLRDLYRRGRERVEGERVKMLFGSAVRHQEEAVEAIDRFEPEVSAQQRYAHFQFTPEEIDEEPFTSAAAVRPEMTVDEAARMIVGHLSKLALIYGRVAEMSTYAEVAEIFRTQEQQIRAMRDRLAQSSQQLKDI